MSLSASLLRRLELGSASGIRLMMYSMDESHHSSFSLLVYPPQVSELGWDVCNGTPFMLANVCVDTDVAEDISGHGEQRLIGAFLAA